MRVTRVFVDQKLVSGKGVGLPEQSGLHLTRVLRLDVGAQVTLFDGTGGEYAGTLERDGKKIWARVGAHDPVERESPLDITLLQGVARGERMDLIVQKATELGVARILPVLAERSVVKLGAEQRDRKLEHWQAVAVSACEQCGRNRVPEVAAPQSLGDAIAKLAPESRRCLLAADASQPLVAAVNGASAVALLIGPEGGLGDNEQRFAAANGFGAYRIGPRILRTETAGLAALAALQSMGGDFR
ncbi:MAG TPA: 16S rRNA (uracil(1498)-N(3))-methyltransferase [Steroidobacteraceae bacterium]|nr:16S rRNA (uracil(1498)-N(3))-methyltransferase [Steroidobacteraceae bacterium]